MLVLGLNQDLYGSGAAIADGDRLLYASNEERFTRKKNQGGFPHRSLEAALAYCGVTPGDIEAVALCGIRTPPLPLRILPEVQQWFHESQNDRSETLLRYFADAVIQYTPMAHGSPETWSSRMQRRIVPSVVRRQFPRGLRRAPVHVVEHHPVHAACAHGLSGFDEALCITADGMGDGVSLSVSHCRGETIERLYWASSRDSFGLFFETLTEAMGFTPCRDEGKLTGLAAMGDPAAVPIESPFTVTDGRVRYDGQRGLRAVKWFKSTLLANYRREDVAAWAQALLDRHLIEVATHWLRATGLNRLSLSGGAAANVKTNQHLHELPEVREIFVAPNMGDGGNPVGALAAAGFLPPRRMCDVFLGEAFTEDEMADALNEAGLEATRPDCIHTAMADALADGKIVARFTGRMEWGPRALGNRSILAAAGDADLVARLNAQLRRTDFMPFAPAMAAHEAPRFLTHYEAGLFAGEFMTVCFRCSLAMREAFPAVVHVDGTARAQIVREDNNPEFHAVLTRFQEKTGAAVLLNTSYNIHEEPIVRTPAEAIRAFQSAGLDVLAMGPFLLTGADIRV